MSATELEMWTSSICLCGQHLENRGRFFGHQRTICNAKANQQVARCKKGDLCLDRRRSDKHVVAHKSRG
jgi:hypothetical protein